MYEVICLAGMGLIIIVSAMRNRKRSYEDSFLVCFGISFLLLVLFRFHFVIPIIFPSLGPGYELLVDSGTGEFTSSGERIFFGLPIVSLLSIFLGAYLHDRGVRLEKEEKRR